MSLPMRVKFEETRKNWELWGQLVEDWIFGIQPLPKEVKGLKDQANTYGITEFTVPGLDDQTNVKFDWYDEKVLSFWLPTEAMLKASRAIVKPGPYPLPVFYDEAFTGERNALTAPEDTLLSKCRVGEYTINYCG